jgi:phospholipase D1/2
MIDRKVVPRMPWHDCHCRLEGQPARDVSRHFIQRWNYSVSTRKKSRKLHHLVPSKDFVRLAKDDSSSKMLAKRLQKAVHAVRAMQGIRRLTVDNDIGENRGFNSNRRISKMLTQAESTGPTPIIQEDQPMLQIDSDQESDDEFSDDDPSAIERRGYQVHTQILRSLSLWSGGVATEHSIQNAYIRLISNAQHFVYIENQFFVSGLEGDPFCSNRIANALVERIRRASENKENFRVMVVMPLLPAFPGKPDDKDASSLRGVMHWQYRTICRGEYSIYHKLFQELDDDPFKYIAFYGLRNHSDRPDEQPQTEEVYIHSKVMVVDDRSCIIGSANVNERSMCGDRDSEIAVVVEDHEMHESVKIANRTFAVGKFGHSFRMKLFEEHFGVTPGTPLYKKYEDPVNRDSWFTMQEQAMRNHQIYDSVFGCLPSDNVSSFKQIDPHMAALNSDGVHGAAANQAHRNSSPSSPSTRPSATPTEPVAAHDDEAALESSLSSPVLDEGRKSVFSGAMTVNLRESSHISVKKEELHQVQGHIVYFPLKFLADEQLEPKLFPAELFQ